MADLDVDRSAGDLVGVGGSRDRHATRLTARSVEVVSRNTTTLRGIEPPVTGEESTATTEAAIERAVTPSDTT